MSEWDIEFDECTGKFAMWTIVFDKRDKELSKRTGEFVELIVKIGEQATEFDKWTGKSDEWTDEKWKWLKKQR